MPTSARCWDFDRPSVGADDLTDAPNFGTKFDWRRPCLRYNRSWHGFAVTEGLPGVDGPFGGDLCLALLSARALFHANSRWFLNISPPRVGADLCVRPDTLPHGTRARADTQVGPYGSYCNLHQTQNNGRGQSPAPTGRSRSAAAGRCAAAIGSLPDPFCAQAQHKAPPAMPEGPCAIVPPGGRHGAFPGPNVPRYIGEDRFYCRLKKNPSTRMPSSTTRKAWGSTSWTTCRSSSTSYLERQTQSTWTFSPV